MAKRLFDLVLSGLGLILLAPLFLVIAIWIKLDSPGPVFFRGRRVGRKGTDFRIIKFRSMSTDAPLTGPELTAGEDQRITKAGRLLRRSKLDELPQLINVFKGEMSLVGPRPEVRRYVDLFAEDYREILEMRPGITDLASLEYRAEAELLGKSDDPEAFYTVNVLPEKIRLAKEYRRHSSVWYDLLLISRTIAALARKKT
ncbi:MAG: sugar transferase [Actinobacteria bacterium]|nr:sugar transferase [Actinomycetota bacterium]